LISGLGGYRKLGAVSYLLVFNNDNDNDNGDAGYTHSLVEKRRKGEVSWKALAAAMQAAIVPAVEKRILAVVYVASNYLSVVASAVPPQ